MAVSVQVMHEMRNQQTQKMLLGIFLLLLFMYNSMGISWNESAAGTTPDSSVGGTQKDAAVGQEKLRKTKSVKVKTQSTAPLAIDTFIPATDFTSLSQPLSKYSKYALICPDVGGKNKLCATGAAEYKFSVPSKGSYYLYIQTIAANIRDNSLWVSPPLQIDTNSKSYKKYINCDDSSTAGPVVPKKHTAKGKVLCCPKYLAANAKKGQASYYSDCCTNVLGPQKDEIACVLDLEVSTKPRWNLMPREYLVSNDMEIKDDNYELILKVYAREDGTIITGLFLSADPKIKLKALPKA